MSFTCPLCRDEWLVINKLCPRCDRVRFIMSCYSRESVIEALEKIFLIDKFKQHSDEKYIKENGKWILKKLEQEDNE